MKEIHCSLYIVKWQQVARELIKSRKRASFVGTFLLYSPVLSARGDMPVKPEEIGKEKDTCRKRGELGRGGRLGRATRLRDLQELMLLWFIILAISPQLFEDWTTLYTTTMTLLARFCSLDRG